MIRYNHVVIQCSKRWTYFAKNTAVKRKIKACIDNNLNIVACILSQKYSNPIISQKFSSDIYVDDVDISIYQYDAYKNSEIPKINEINASDIWIYGLCC